MATIASGIFKQVRIKKETTFGTPAGATGAQLLRRVTSSIDLNKDAYQSREIVSTQQTKDFRHGVRRVGGRIDGELSSNGYPMLFEAMLRNGWTAGASASGLSITGASGPPGTFTRSAGDWIADGFEVGDVVRFTGMTTDASNNNKNYRITALTTTVLTTSGVGDETVGAGGPDASVTCDVVGKKVWVPTTGHTDDSFTVEHWFGDINQSELFTGLKPTQMDLGLPATGMATVSTTFLGQDQNLTDTTEYFTTPTAETSGRVMAAVNGSLRVNDTDIALVTGASFTISGGHTTEPVVGSDFVPEIFPGRVTVQGQLTAFFEDGVLRDLFKDEVDTSLYLTLKADGTLNSSFINISMPRVKLNGSAKDDGEKGLVQTLPFVALQNDNPATGTKDTTIVIQDSDVP